MSQPPILNQPQLVYQHYNKLIEATNQPSNSSIDWPTISTFATVATVGRHGSLQDGEVLHIGEVGWSYVMT